MSSKCKKRIKKQAEERNVDEMNRMIEFVDDMKRDKVDPCLKRKMLSFWQTESEYVANSLGQKKYILEPPS